MRVCEVAGCERKHFGRGFCQMHYMRWRQHGNPHTRLSSNNWAHLPSVIAVGWMPNDAGMPMPYSSSLRQRLATLEYRDAARDRRDENRYVMSCSSAGIWRYDYRERKVA